jgi:hybrid polyketide synthase/nonribosomal peptide synthetase ACE1
MAAELIEEFPYCRDIIDSLDRALSALPNGDQPAWTLRNELLKDESTSRVNEAEFSQPLCTAIQILLVEILRRAGIKFAAIVGHSSGEISAAFAAGVLSARDAICIAYYRGKYTSLAMGPSGSAGAMLAVGTSWNDAQELSSWDEFSGKVVVAACNSPSSVTLSGDADALKQIDVILDDERKFRRWLKIDKAYHSPHMRPCSSPYLYALQRCSIKPMSPGSECLWVSSVDLESEEEIIPGMEGPYWNDNMLRPVRFMQAIDRAFSKVDHLDLVVEIGPHPALRAPVMDTIEKHLPNRIPYSGMLYRGKSAVTAIADTLLFLQSNMTDSEVDWDNLDMQLGGVTSLTVVPDLPVYQWNHDRSYWHNSPYLHRLLHRKHDFHSILGRVSPESSPDQLRWRNILRPAGIPWVLDHRLQNQAVFPAAGYIVAALEASMIFSLDADLSVQIVELRHISIYQPLTFSSDNDPGVEVIFSFEKIHHDKSSGCLTARFSCLSSSHGRETLQLMASTEIHMFLGQPEMDLIPSQDSDGFHGRNVSKDQFYDSLDMLGYGYSGLFRTLDSLQRKRGYSAGLVTVPALEKNQTAPFLLHPAVLDMSIQSLLLAHSYPFDGQLGSIFVPTSIDMIRVNPFVLRALHTNCPEIAVSANLADKRQLNEILGDVDITDINRQHLAVQLQGVRAVPFAPPTATDDRQMFAQMNWVHSLVDAKAVNIGIIVDADQYKLAEALERTACFYLRQVSQENSKGSIEVEMGGVVASYLRFAAHVTTSVSQGIHPYARTEWIHDRLEDIMEITAP